MKVSYSRLKSWRRCHRQHFYKYTRNLDRKKKPLALARGSVIHDVFDKIINGKAWKPRLEEFRKEFGKLFAEEREQFGDVPHQIERTILNYREHYAHDGLTYLPGKGKDGKQAKSELAIEVPEFVAGVTLVGYLDAAVQDQNGKQWVFERKTHGKRIPTEEQRVSDYQTVLYNWAVKHLGMFNPVGVIWDHVRLASDTQPQLLKSGKAFSQNAHQDIDYYTFRDAIRKAKFPEAEYHSFLADRKGKLSRYFQRPRVPVSRVMEAQVLDDARRTAIEIRELSDIETTRSLSFDCSRCNFFSLCQAELRGLDTDFILKHEYQQREHDDATENNVEEEAAE